MLTVSKLFTHSFVRYCLVGAIGFVVDWVFLQIVVCELHFSPVYGRFVSYTIALCITWLLHRYFTFAIRNPAAIGELARYFLSNVFGAGVNIGVYSLLVLLAPPLGLTIPLGIASIAALVVNYFSASLFVFMQRNS